MDVVMENSCKNIFISDQSKMRETFTRLWIQVINEKENSIKISIDRDIQTNII